MSDSDSELLAEYARCRSDAAFERIVSRYMSLVYTAAVRQVRDLDLAQDVAQAAFIVLARRAGSIRPEHLAGWLMNTTRYCARDALRKQTRRVRHEHEAAAMKPMLTPPDDSSAAELAAGIDDALSRLRARESTAVAMRYLQNRPVAEVAAAMEITVHAAQKVIARSLVKLRGMLKRRGIVLSTTAALAGLLTALPSHAAPPGGGAAGAYSLQSQSIAKGAMTMMRWMKIKIAAAVGAAVVTAAGAVVLSQVTATPQPPAPPAASTPPAGSAAPAAAAAMPLLELVGCRIKEPIDLRLTAQPRPPATLTLIQQQYPEVHWTLAGPAAGEISSYAITVGPADDPAAATNLAIDKDTTLAALQHELADPGDYLVTVSGLGADAKPVAQVAVKVHVKPLPFTQIMVNDLQPDGVVRFTSAIQVINTAGQTIHSDGFYNSDFVQVDAITDDQGRPLQFTTDHRNQTYQYRYQLTDPVPPGQPLMIGSSGTMPGQTRSVGGGTFVYSFTHSPGVKFPTRRVELFMLPPGATLISQTPATLKSRIVDSRVQILVDTMISAGGSNSVAFEYRMPEGK